MPGKLILLPNTLDGGSLDYLPMGLADRLKTLDGVIAETPKVARALLKQFELKMALQALPVETLDKNSTKEQKKTLLGPLLDGQCWGLMSDAGLPCIADPGSEMVKMAREKGIEIEALSGPSSIFMALMLSGLNGQKFAFHGYLPQEEAVLAQTLKKLVQASKNEAMTQIFIETPFRNERLLRHLLQYLPEETLLSVACDLTKEGEWATTLSVKNWKKRDFPVLHKKAVIFAFLVV